MSSDDLAAPAHAAAAGFKAGSKTPKRAKFVKAVAAAQPLEHSNAAVEAWACSFKPGGMPSLTCIPGCEQMKQPLPNEVFLMTAVTAFVEDTVSALATTTSRDSSVSPSSPLSSPTKVTTPKIYEQWHAVICFSSFAKVIYPQYTIQAMASFSTIKWLRNLVRQDSGTGAGKGVFVVNHVIPAITTVACYWGHVVDDTGLIQVRHRVPFVCSYLTGCQIPCPPTKHLLTTVKNVRRKFSPGHCVGLSKHLAPLTWLVDGEFNFQLNVAEIEAVC
jgi:hypothetical protein